MMQRAGLRRRGAAALVDMALALLLVQGLAAVGFQLTGGHVTTGLNTSTVCSSAAATAATVDLPSGDVLPSGFVPDRASLCRSSVFGAATGLAYVVSRTDVHAGLDVTTSHAFPVDLAWHAAGGRVDLDPFLLPLFVLTRWAFDRFAGATPGRWLARIRLTEAESVGARMGTALGADVTRRYLLFGRPYIPILAVASAEALFALLAGGDTPFLAVAAVLATTFALASQVAAAAAIRRGRSAFYDRPHAMIVADLASLRPAGMASEGLSVPRSGHAYWALVGASITTVVWIDLSRPSPVHGLRPSPSVERIALPSPATEQTTPPAVAEPTSSPMFAPDTVAMRSAEAAELAARAEGEAEEGQSSASLADVAYAIQVEQGVTDLAVSRDFAFETEAIVGRNLFLGGDTLHAIAEDSRALTLRNGDSRVLKQRAFAEFFTAEQSEALADLDAVLINAPGDAEATLWREIVARRLGRASTIGADGAIVDASRWPAPIIDLFQGRSTPEVLRSRILDDDLSKWKQRQCEADFYIGEWHLIHGEANPARDALREALRDCAADEPEAHEAEDELLGRAGFK